MEFYVFVVNKISKQVQESMFATSHEAHNQIRETFSSVTRKMIENFLNL